MDGGPDPSRRTFLALGSFIDPGNRRHLDRIVIRVRVLFDQGAHAGKGLGEAERSRFHRYQESARRAYENSGISFDLQYVEGAYLRRQGYSEIPYMFLARRCINLFVTDALGYDVDRDRTGGSSIGPHPPVPRYGSNPYYKTFLGLSQAGETTLAHEYAHHFALDTTRRPTTSANFWADLRNDFWLWRQRQGALIVAFRACGNAEFASRMSN